MRVERVKEGEWSGLAASHCLCFLFLLTRFSLLLFPLSFVLHFPALPLASFSSFAMSLFSFFRRYFCLPDWPFASCLSLFLPFFLFLFFFLCTTHPSPLSIPPRCPFPSAYLFYFFFFSVLDTLRSSPHYTPVPSISLSLPWFFFPFIFASVLSFPPSFSASHYVLGIFRPSSLSHIAVIFVFSLVLYSY